MALVVELPENPDVLNTPPFRLATVKSWKSLRPGKVSWDQKRVAALVSK